MDPVLLRFLERLTVVLLGGLSIYLGFRLFLEVPEHKDSSGKVVLPWDISIVMTKVGPGVFFALFGVATVGLALLQPLEISLPGRENAEKAENTHGQVLVHYAGRPALGDSTAHADARALLRKELAVLNTIPRLLRDDLADYDRSSIEHRIRHVKLTLMKPVWGEPDEGFGEFAEFERWVREAEITPPPAGMEEALTLYRYGSKETSP